MYMLDFVGYVLYSDLNGDLLEVEYTTPVFQTSRSAKVGSIHRWIYYS